MPNLNALRKILGLRVDQAHPVPLGNNTQAAKQYAANPQASQFKNIDPAQFGYPTDNSGSRLNVQSQHSPANLGVPYGVNPTGSLLNQGNEYNPGFTPLQGSFGVQATPQTGAFQPYQSKPPQFNPQDNPYQQRWLQ